MKRTAAEHIEHWSIPEPNSGCWLWIGSALPAGYGHTRMDGRPWRAHRLSYRAFVGPIAPGLLICHKCDTPACVNPDHLFAGTYRDNCLDMHRKGRNPDFRVSHCKHGHPATPENRRSHPKGGTVCVPCGRSSSRDCHRRQRAAARASGAQR